MKSKDALLRKKSKTEAPPPTPRYSVHIFPFLLCGGPQAQILLHKANNVAHAPL